MRLFLTTIKILCSILFLATKLAHADTQFSITGAEGGIAVTGCSGDCPPHLTIPQTIDGQEVISIANEAFRDDDLFSLNLPEGLQVIGVNAFSYNNLSDVVIPSTVTEIKDGAFYNNSYLSSLTLNEGLLFIGENAFHGGSLTELAIPNSVTEIDRYAFKSNDISNLSFGNGLTTIAFGAFSSNELETLTLPDSLVRIESYALRENKINEIDIPFNVVYLGGYAFQTNPLSRVRFLGYRPTLDAINSSIYQQPFDSLTSPGLQEVFYCDKTIGWPTVPIEGITPQLDENCDSDRDTVSNTEDLFPFDATETEDSDLDGVGNNSDTDDDNDGVQDAEDAFPFDSSESIDTDNDGVGNNTDNDDDGDLVPDSEDAFPLDYSESLDSDFDGIGNNADEDDDNDAVIDTEDAFPLDPSESMDNDSDGIGNNNDDDDDNDGILDDDDAYPFDPNNNLGGGNEDEDNDSSGESQEPVILHQSVTAVVEHAAVLGENLEVIVKYDTTDSNDSLTGLGFRLHYDSSVLTFVEFQSILSNNNISAVSDVEDLFDLDNDISTDRYITASWASLYLDWPGVLPADLLDLKFVVSDDESLDNTELNFSSISTTVGYEFLSEALSISIFPGSWDFDKNGIVDALTDGLLMLRHTFGLSGNTLTDYAVSPDSPSTAEEIQAHMEKVMSIADIDGDGNVDALTDGLLLLRYAFEVRGEILIKDVISPDAERTSAADIEAYLEFHMP